MKLNYSFFLQTFHLPTFSNLRFLLFVGQKLAYVVAGSELSICDFCYQFLLGPKTDDCWSQQLVFSLVHVGLSSFHFLQKFKELHILEIFGLPYLVEIVD